MGTQQLQTYAFIDASNIIYGARSVGWYIDQQKLLFYLRRKYQVKNAYFYFGSDSSNSKKIKFLNKLASFGFILRVKEIKRFGSKIKANCDVDLTMDMLIKISEYDRAIVLTGDGDFLPLFQFLMYQGKKITILSFPRRTAREIRAMKKYPLGEFVDLEELKYFIMTKK